MKTPKEILDEIKDKKLTARILCDEQHLKELHALNEHIPDECSFQNGYTVLHFEKGALSAVVNCPAPGDTLPLMMHWEGRKYYLLDTEPKHPVYDLPISDVSPETRPTKVIMQDLKSLKAYYDHVEDD